MEKIDLVLSADYEVWGDGSGRVDTCVIEPTKRMLQTAEKYGAKITFFLDVCEYWAFEQVEKLGAFTPGYKPATWMREQLQEALGKGHDVQLHFHPQWLNYKMQKDDQWELDYRYWRLPEVDNYHDKDWNLGKLFSEGVRTLERLFKPLKNDYRVTAFRAGAWCIQPEEKILDQLKSNHINIDSTVAPGMKKTGGRTTYDFRKTPEKAFWEVHSKVTDEGKSGIFEFPITTGRIELPLQLLFKMLKLSNASAIYPTDIDSGKKPSLSLPKKIGMLISERYNMLNYSDGTSFQELKYITNKARRKLYKVNSGPIPMIAISHPKTFGLRNNFDRYLNWISNQKDYRFVTFSDYFQYTGISKD